MNAGTTPRCPRCYSKTFQGLDEQGWPICASCKRAIEPGMTAQEQRFDHNSSSTSAHRLARTRRMR
jgi:hypothetical protein